MPRVLIVDDFPLSRRGARTILESQSGWECCGEAESGEAALDVLDRCGADVVLMDVCMPGIGGLKATKVLRDAAPEVKVILLTMNDSTEFLRAGLLAGAWGYVLKTDPETELLSALQVVHGNGTYISRSIDRAVATKVMREVEQQWKVEIRHQGQLLH